MVGRDRRRRNKTFRPLAKRCDPNHVYGLLFNRPRTDASCITFCVAARTPLFRRHSLHHFLCHYRHAAHPAAPLASLFVSLQAPRSSGGTSCITFCVTARTPLTRRHLLHHFLCRYRHAAHPAAPLASLFVSLELSPSGRWPHGAATVRFRADAIGSYAARARTLPPGTAALREARPAEPSE